jgi:Na+-transporting NADH:ubiquinone oxidoreductase subunit NqrF
MSILVADIKFYVVDDDGNEKLNKEGTHIQLYELKQGRRFKALEYLTEDMDMDLLEEINE